MACKPPAHPGTAIEPSVVLPPDTLPGALSDAESAELAQCEATITQGLRSFVEVGQALARIRTAKLYRAEYPTFERYVSDRWEFEISEAYRRISAARVYEIVSPIGEIPPPANEAQARELAALIDEPNRLRQVWYAACRHAEEAGQRVTAALVRAVRDAQGGDQHHDDDTEHPPAGQGERHQAGDDADHGEQHQDGDRAPVDPPDENGPPAPRDVTPAPRPGDGEGQSDEERDPAPERRRAITEDVKDVLALLEQAAKAMSKLAADDRWTPDYVTAESGRCVRGSAGIVRRLAKAITGFAGHPAEMPGTPARFDGHSPLRHVATELGKAGTRGATIAEMAGTYHHANPGDLQRIKPWHGLDNDRQAQHWLIDRAIAALGGQVRPATTAGRWRLAVPLAALQYDGRPVVVRDTGEAGPS